MTYDQGSEMYSHKILIAWTIGQIYFADPHSTWQHGFNQNKNDLLRQYMPEVSDLSIYLQDDFDAVVLSLNTKPGETIGWKTPVQSITSIWLAHNCKQI